MATLSINYSGWTDITLQTQGRSSSATLVPGRESAVIDNTSNKYDDVLVSGVWTSGISAPTINTQVVVYVGALLDGTTYPDVFDGTESDETLTSVGVGNSFLRTGAVMIVDNTTTSLVYSCLFSVAELFDYVMPPNWFLFVTHNTGVASNSITGWPANGFKYNGIKYTVA